MNKNIQTFLGCDAEYAEAEIVLFGVPFDGTTSFRPGTRFGPSAIRNESFGIETYSPYCDRDIADYLIFDGGDLELPFGNTQKVLEMTQEYAAQILADGKRFVMLGGEHLVTLGAVRAVVERYPDVHIIHFDAHTDLRTDYLGETLSHSTVIKQAWNLVGDGKIHQFGIRSGEKYEFTFAENHTKLHKFDLQGLSETVAQLKDKPVYFTLDLDVLDPSIFCGTGTPEAGGISFKELMGAVLQLNQLNIVGCDINELSPHYDQSGSSTAVACKITREIILQITK
ncbi:agmatinase [Anaerotignum neopropionicum]|uniref:Agmatinase n=1 Tax=Anaerotignum neopropionicum TaxID=36847 RepID=A0A136WEX3_9FIRM|nr:agmatinase [Anaerotignum neopropionicum]KXL53096.1 agmatinase [Anaerotignum neopropionicum]